MLERVKVTLHGEVASEMSVFAVLAAQALS